MNLYKITIKRYDTRPVGGTYDYEYRQSKVIDYVLAESPTHVAKFYENEAFISIKTIRRGIKTIEDPKNWPGLSVTSEPL